MIENFIQSQNKVNKKHDEEFRQMNLRLYQLATHNIILEHQIASQESSSNYRQIGHFPSQPENPKKQVKTVTLRNRKQLPEIECKSKKLRIKPEQIQDKAEKSKQNVVNQTPKQKKMPCLPFP